MDGRISDLAFLAARRFGDETALTMLGGASLGFAEIDDRAGRVAGALAAQGIGRGDRIVLHLPNGPEWLIAYHAIARLGAVVAPANILLAPAEVAFIARDAEAVLVILGADREAAVAEALGEAAARILAVPADGGGPWAALLAGPYHAPVEVAADDLFTLGYTSGTTGTPKGAMLSHGNVFASTALTATIHVRVRGEAVLTALPFPHVYGNVVMNAAFLTGQHLLVMPRFDAGDALRAIAAHRPALFEGVPTMYYQMLAHPDLSATDFASLTRCTVGGQTMPVSKIDEVVDRFGCPLCELWGMTEVSGPAASHSPYWPPRHGTIGLAFPGVDLRVADLDDAARDAPDGTAGELRIRGPLVTRGYWRNPAATEAVFDAAGWMATGDIAIRDPDGHFRIVDRRKDLIITGGYNIYPAELEQVIASHPAVAMVAVAGMPDPEKGELAKAFVVLRPDARCDGDELAAHCRQHLARYKVPRAFAFVDDLPKTSTGKIMRRALQPQPIAS